MVQPELPEPFKYRLVLDADNRALPREVCNEISNELWVNEEQSNGSTLFYSREDHGEDAYPRLDAYLELHGVKECYIHYSW